MTDMLDNDTYAPEAAVQSETDDEKAVVVETDAEEPTLGEILAEELVTQDALEAEQTKQDPKANEKQTEINQSADTTDKKQHQICKQYIHVGCDNSEPLCELFEKYGFSYNRYGEDADLYELHGSMAGCRIAVIFESSDVIVSNKNMAYQVREALACKREVVIVCKRDYTDFSRKFEGESGVTVIKTDATDDIIHLLFVEKLCKMPELFDAKECERDECGELIRHAFDAWTGVAASEKYLAEKYLEGVILPKLPRQAVFWLSCAKENGSLRAIVSLGDCYFEGKGCPENKKKAFDLYCEAAERGTAEGLYKKGKCKLYGEGCEADYDEAYSCLKLALALKKDFYEVEYCIGLCFLRGHGAEKSYQDAKAHLLRSAKGNYLPALLELGDMFSSASSDDYNPTLALEYYGRAAMQGSAQAYYKRGLMLSSGEGCNRDEAGAFESFSLGASLKDMFCICALGMCYEQGIGCTYDYKKAVECYTYAADRAHAAANNNLGGCYYYGHGVPKNRKKAIELFERAALLGDANAMTRLGLCYEQGTDLEKDIKKAFSYFSRAAALDNATAAYKTALCYASGLGCDKDAKRAYSFFELAARLGHAEAMWKTACCLSDGIGVVENDREAFNWYSLGAESSHAGCYFKMAQSLFRGIGTGKNYSKAYYCYTKAYELYSDRDTYSVDLADLCMRIGICELRGLGAKQNAASALEWFKRAAARDNADGMFMCGESYFYGSGCQQNSTVAAQYYTLAEQKGHQRASIALARCYESGFGVPKSFKRAASLYKKLSDNGISEASYRLANMIYENGGAPETARELFFLAANKGHVGAMLRLGEFYENGISLPENYDKAAEKYLHAIALSLSKQKNLLFSMPDRDREKHNSIRAAATEATFRLGMLRGRHSRSVEDYTGAFEYLAGAAATGSRAAQIEIARIFASGGDLQAYFNSQISDEEPSIKQIADAMNKLGDAWYSGEPLLSKNDRAALRCYRISASLGNNDAAYSLGWCLRHGVGTRVDDVEAVKWLKKSADLGNIHAMYSYGLCCEEGSGMEHPNLREAATYYRKAGAAGHAQAKKRHLRIVTKH